MYLVRIQRAEADLAVNLLRARPDRGHAEPFDYDPDSWLFIVIHNMYDQRNVLFAILSLCYYSSIPRGEPRGAFCIERVRVCF